MNGISQTFNPRTGALVGSYPRADEAEVAAAAARAGVAFRQHWRHRGNAERAAALASIARWLRSESQAVAAAEAADTGKSLETALGEVEGAASLWDYAAALARTVREESMDGGSAGALAMTLREPLGVVGMILPWNYPLITAAERLPFALAAGCCVIVKPSEWAVGALAMLTAAIRANPLFPPDVVQVVFGEGRDAGRALVEHEAIDMIAFVGSTKAGREIEAAAVARGKRVSSELGGNNFVLVHADADLPRAASAVLAGGLRNAGQACIAGTHVLVEPSAADAFVDALQGELRRYLESAQLQPMINEREKHRVQRLLALAGDQLHLLPGSRMDGPGNWLGPVVLDHVPLDSPLLAEEIFGPVITITRAPADEFSAAVAASGYGLAVYLWTESSRRALSLARDLRVGRIWINADPEAWLPELPVGGFAASGVGRECGPWALETYSLPKSVLIG
ncbi:aldehyde dehydrogenase family protein [Chromobacterium paludis]|uniref:Aldehyde dehydrogenase n=1 Tax=Chromobacterium paludis TaxID=2605945 RepID=A0A5C1DIW8_9NEIS|nr:aldehyde dehydrogenase family protein [Chromobacterium paludis]QEL56624.1 aldehyde dehydrogenase [Chromobacterium paludis]